MVIVQSPPQLLLDPSTLKRWTVKEYRRLSQLGVLSSDERTELLAGQIAVMASKGTPHVIALQLLALQLDDFFRDKFSFVRAQDPIELGELSEPEPDLAIVKGEILTYIDHHPQPQEIYLVIEIADTTLKKDCDVKDKLYAEAGLQEYWVVDLKNRKLHVFRQPTAQGYGSHLILSDTNKISPITFPELVLEISSMLPPNT